MRALYLTTCLATTVATKAAASPWVEPPGAGYVRGAVALEDVEGFRARRYDVYGKFGLTDHWTLTAKVETVRFEDAGFAEDQDGVRLTFRYGLKRAGLFRTSLEAGVVQGRAIGGFDGCSGTGVELRASGGAGWSSDRDNYFAFADVVTRQHRDGCFRNRLELGYGRTLGSPDWQLISQLWLERGDDGQHSDKTELSLVRKTDLADFTLAYRQELSGRFNETAIVFAISKDF